jgi:hypothetical protein
MLNPKGKLRRQGYRSRTSPGQVNSPWGKCFGSLDRSCASCSGAPSLESTRAGPTGRILKVSQFDQTVVLAASMIGNSKEARRTFQTNPASSYK